MKKILDDYKDFLDSDGASVPQDLRQNTQEKIVALLKPSAWLVFFKLIGIHSLVGSLSLAVCHQFEMNPFQTNVSLAHWFMSMGGHGACMIFCGVLFVGGSVLAAGCLLSREEVRALRRTEFLQILALGVLSLVAFKLVGAELVLTFTGLWLLGALLGGFLAAEISAKLRTA